MLLAHRPGFCHLLAVAFESFRWQSSTSQSHITSKYAVTEYIIHTPNILPAKSLHPPALSFEEPIRLHRTLMTEHV